MSLRKSPIFLALFVAALGVSACGSTDSAGNGGTASAADALGGDGSLSTGDGTAGDDASAGADAAGDDATAGTDAATTDTGPSIDDMPCPSGAKYTFGENDDMQTGNNCIQCHGQQGGPAYKIAGTVFRNLITQTGCYASGSAGSLVPPASYTVEITDANAKVFKTTTSTLSGNFHMSSKQMAGFTPPYTARILDAAGHVRKMVGEQTEGDCNICHTAAGDQGAPGRIVAPSAP